MLRVPKELSLLAPAAALVLGTGTIAFAQSAPGTPVGPSLPRPAINRQMQIEALKAAGVVQLALDTRQLQIEANQRAALSVGEAGIAAEQAQIGAKILRDRLSRTHAHSGQAFKR